MVAQTQAAPGPRRQAPLEMSGADFRLVGHRLVDRIGEFLDGIAGRPVTPADPPAMIRDILGPEGIPEQGMPATELMDEATELLFSHSLLNGHPRFWGYITSSAAPIGALGDLLAAAVNPNVGAATLSPMATEIEAQTIRWIAELVGYPTTAGGLLVSGGNVANITGFLAGIRAKANWDLAVQGMGGARQRVYVYASAEAHGWLRKGVEISGLGTEAIRWIPADADRGMDLEALKEQVIADRAVGARPLMVIGTAGSVATGAIDPLAEIAALCRKYDLWFHVDGAYGAPAALLVDAPARLRALGEADSLALDPHKWLYAPLEAGCALVRDPEHLLKAFSHHASYYNFAGKPEDPPINYLDLGLQNSRGFRALKVWLALRQVGRAGYRKMLGDDIALAQAVHRQVALTEELEPGTQNLSITTFRYVPVELAGHTGSAATYLDELNRAVLDRLQNEGEAFISNAVIAERYFLRACIVNFRTSQADVDALPGIVVRLGRELDAKMRPAHLMPAALQTPRRSGSGPRQRANAPA